MRILVNIISFFIIVFSVYIYGFVFFPKYFGIPVSVSFK